MEERVQLGCKSCGQINNLTMKKVKEFSKDNPYLCDSCVKINSKQVLYIENYTQGHVNLYSILANQYRETLEISKDSNKAVNDTKLLFKKLRQMYPKQSAISTTKFDLDVINLEIELQTEYDKRNTTYRNDMYSYYNASSRKNYTDYTQIIATVIGYKLVYHY